MLEQETFEIAKLLMTLHLALQALYQETVLYVEQQDREQIASAVSETSSLLTLYLWASINALPLVKTRSCARSHTLNYNVLSRTALHSLSEVTGLNLRTTGSFFS
jgi:hypothetical protein